MSADSIEAERSLRHPLHRLLALAILVAPLSSGGANVVLCTAADGHRTLEASHPGRACDSEERRHGAPDAPASSPGVREGRDCSDADLGQSLGPQESVSKRLLGPHVAFLAPGVLPPPRVAARLPRAGAIPADARARAALRSVVLLL